ncbi:YfiT family bacillithiol transferase [Persicobacter diffluens]|uniref:Metal-dependent hydrolase n=1 Tax=Persicobacter diffluens TaxID=981 RepID=A0AAN5ALT4_9BACT|nr:putative metal-dependent hydrolase [Persicobacter diffluens]
MIRQDLQYPIGEFQTPNQIHTELLETWITEIRQFPVQLEELISHSPPLSEEWKYRPNGWNIRQLVHHCADSHMNSFIRFKLALTEENPSILPYQEALWANVPDTQNAPIQSSLTLLHGLHQRWVILLQNLSKEQLNRTFYHPESKKSITLRENTGIYAWHCRHHLAHVKLALDAKGKWN